MAKKALGPKDGQIEVDAYLADCVEIEPTAIDEEFIRVPADLAYWNEQYAVAHKRHLMAKLDAEREESRLLLEVREAMLSDWHTELVQAAAAKSRPPREPSVDTIRAAMLQHPDYRRAQLELLDAEVERYRLRGLVSALEAKKDMLQSLGAKIRSEMTDPLLRAAMRGIG